MSIKTWKRERIVRRIWTDEEDQYLRINYPGGDTMEICKVLNRSKYSIYGRINLLGLKKTKEAKKKYGSYFTGEEGKAYRYPKGHVPANKGKAMSPELYAKAKHTMFKKGDQPKNHLPVGSITERTNYKRNSTYLYIKIAEPNKWKHLHRHIWEFANGKIPSGLNLVFKDGNYKNCKLENLELLTDGELMARNTIHNRYPQDLVNAIMTLGALKRKVNEQE